MSRRLSRISLVLAMLMSSKVWAFGLGEIHLESALSEPLRAQIELLSVTPEELKDLKIGMASADTFQRYGLNRPYYLQNIRFHIVHSGKAKGKVVRIFSATPMREPILNFLVEANLPSGRLIREYTVLLDPPTYTLPGSTEQAVQASVRPAGTDSGRIKHSPAPAAVPMSAMAEQEHAHFDTTEGGEVIVQQRDTLSNIAQRVSPDSRLTLNQVMLAIFRANPKAFGGNINILRAGSRLRIPSADEIYRTNRGEAQKMVRRQNQSWHSVGAAEQTSQEAPKPSLTLVIPGGEYKAGATAEEQSVRTPKEVSKPSLTLVMPGEKHKAGETSEEQSAGAAKEAAPGHPKSVEEKMLESGAVKNVPVYGKIKTKEVQPVTAAEGKEKTTEQERSSQIIHADKAKPGFTEQAPGLLKSYNWTFVVGVLVIVGGLMFWMMRLWMMRRGGESEIIFDTGNETVEISTYERISEMPSVESTLKSALKWKLKSPVIEQHSNEMSDTAAPQENDETSLEKAIEGNSHMDDHSSELNISGLYKLELAALIKDVENKSERQVVEHLLDVTGMAQVESPDLVVDTTTDAKAELTDDDATQIMSLDDDEDMLGDDDQKTQSMSLDVDEDVLGDDDQKIQSMSVDDEEDVLGDDTRRFA